MAKLTTNDCVKWNVKGGVAVAKITDVQGDEGSYTKILSVLPTGQSFDLTAKANEIEVIDEASYDAAVTSLVADVEKNRKSKANKTKEDQMTLEVIKAEFEIFKTDAEKKLAEAKVAADAAAEASAKALAELEAKLKATEVELAAQKSKCDDMETSKKGADRFKKMKAVKADSMFGKTEDEATSVLAKLSDEAFELSLKTAEFIAKSAGPDSNFVQTQPSNSNPSVTTVKQSDMGCSNAPQSTQQTQTSLPNSDTVKVLSNEEVKEALDTAKTEVEPTLEKAAETVSTVAEDTKNVLGKVMAYAVGHREKKTDKSNKTK